MSALTENRSTEKRLGFGLAPLVKDAAVIYCGSMVAIDKTTGEAEPAADAANLVVKGRANEYIDNTDDGLRVQIEVGIFCWENSAGNAVTDTDLICYVEDDQTVSSDPGDNAVIAGVVVDIDDDGVWVDSHPAAVAAAIGKNPVAALVADPAACADMTTDLTGVDTGTDMTAAQAAMIVADLGALKTAIDANKAAVDASNAALIAAGLMASA
ncbi:MAG: hypothetical protein L3J71_03550 [Victivallaceae bacterium]|nr:hypothetical protein [Victivallaceae bacterium]